MFFIHRRSRSILSFDASFLVVSFSIGVEYRRDLGAGGAVRCGLGGLLSRS